ncbi:NUDIX hydrolase [Terrisporobacter mayombei]|uniref:NUDIX hydrolase n=1 Tax=Terrisporobacter mayombei TaxID=1541 RepID=UPI0026594C01|nr:NUDIX hydrolase [Terrisporobacter mayombei]MCC3670881.1 NUDIX hydrolase [Terrisporobacter mayombei]
MNLRKEIENYLPYNCEEEKDKEIMIKYMDTFDDVLTRNNEIGHFTSSCWIVNKDKTKVLMAYHNIYDSWAWTGGHADGDGDLLHVSLKEAKEETGLKDVRPLSDEIFSLEVLGVDGHIKRGKYVPSHIHLNATYLLCADETEMTHIKADENSAVKWFELDKAVKASNEPYMKKIYSKLNKKLKDLKK